MEFMKKTEASVSNIEAAVATLSKDHGILKTNLENHIKDDESKKDLKESHDRALDRKNWAIGVLVSVLLVVMGYIWGNDKHNSNDKKETVQERVTESPG